MLVYLLLMSIHSALTDTSEYKIITWASTVLYVLNNDMTLD